MISARDTAPDAGQTLVDLLDGAARGCFPVPGGGLTVLPQPSLRGAGVPAFTAHSVVFVNGDPRWVAEALA